MRTKSGLLLFIILLFLGSNSSYGDILTQEQKGKLDPYLRMLILHPESVAQGTIPGTLLRKGAVDFHYGVFVSTDGTFTEVRSTGAVIQSIIGNTATVLATQQQLLELVNFSNVLYIESPKTCRPSLNQSVPEIGASYVQAQYGLTGEGIIIGVIDTGIDWQHQDFRKADGTTRIKYLLDFSDPGDINGDGILDGPDDYGGTLHDEDEINAALQGSGVNEKDYNGHGSHVAGIAAGNGRASGYGQPAGQYVGVAPEASLIIVKTPRTLDGGEMSDVDILNALAFIDSKASALGMPYVANMSLGHHYGAHDGTHAIERSIDIYVKSGVPGKAVVVAAGNEGDYNIHTSSVLSPTNNSITFKIEVDPYTATAGTMNDYIVINGWYDGNASHAVRIKTPGGNLYPSVSSGQQNSFESTEGYIYVDNASAGVNIYNGDKELMVQFFDKVAMNTPASGTWEITVTGFSGRMDCWLASSTMFAEFTIHVDDSRKVGIPATANNAIAVGSYITKAGWTDLDGNNLSWPGLQGRDGDLSTFSNPGPTRDGRIKPDLNAPGEVISAAFSSDADPLDPDNMYYSGSSTYPNGLIVQDGVHAISRGTSMAAPHVAGVVALAFQNNPSLDAIDVRQMLIDSAREDTYTGTVPNDYWGYGKLNARGATSSVPSGDEDEIPNQFQLHPTYPNPFSPSTHSNPLTINYTIPSGQNIQSVLIIFYDLLGREVYRSVAGTEKFFWDGRNQEGELLGSGIYFIRLEAGGYVGKGKILLFH